MSPGLHLSWGGGVDDPLARAIYSSQIVGVTNDLSYTTQYRQWQIVGVTNLFRGAMDITRHAGQAPLWRNLASRLLNQTAILVGRVVSEALAVEGTHRYQLAALATLDAFGAVSQAELCRRTNIDRSDMNAVVNALEAEGIVTRVSDPDDRRQNIVEMTETGKARFERLKAGLAEAEDRALAPLAPADRRELLRLLRILHDYHAVPPPSAESRG
ncbi:MAG: MarR family winged helix-turn-helix transcriptional regulator [Methylocella sp.]